ncbi:substrate-binding domain-containing protein [Tianweitania sediminis]|uniref:Substrate-binding domain-containing protein n=1 Tax=Tianweitania sediminis TaxID=1502156 RepID=A0A8J7QY86_9HYPH|nr:substrate-binding domain-containing protein [Tianweitania sediminis]MBP0438140.1 substrate-binding domain-containing protein [Tianweitania sediminis]
MNKLMLSTAIAAVLFAGHASAQSRDTIQIAGSSTVLPFASIVAEEFGNAFPDFKAPVVGSGGSGGGLKQFCQGVGENTIDIANSSRPIKKEEIATCNQNGVNKIHEVKFGYDGIVFATSADQGEFKLEPVHVFKAIAAKVPVDGKMVDNPYTTWNEIDPSLPNQEINVAIPGSNHGTREVFQDNVIAAGCEAAELPADAGEEACETFRQDRVVEISGDYTETLARLQANPATMGVFGLSFYDQNRDTLKVATMSGVSPSLETVASGEYPVSRPLFFYVKGEHIGTIPGIQEYTEFFLSDQMAGAGGTLEGAGLIPMPEEERAAALKSFQDGETKSASN